MTARRLTLLVMLAGCAFLAAPTIPGHGPRFIWNASASVPIGLYRIAPLDRIEVADLVAVLPPEPLASFLAERGYLPRNVPLIKRVLALPGTPVCRHDTTIVAYDHAYGEARETDTLGRDLPVWQGCRTPAEGEVFLMNWDVDDSFDGRYFGPLPASAITARVIPIWTDPDGNGRFRWHAEDDPAAP
jgi:conjugative transfer signal peptidase TraF